MLLCDECRQSKPWTDNRLGKRGGYTPAGSKVYTPRSDASSVSHGVPRFTASLKIPLHCLPHEYGGVCMTRPWHVSVVILLICVHQFAFAQDGTYGVRLLTPETALKAAQSALAKCRADGYQVTVAVVDRSGVLQVLLRDRFAGPHTPDMAVSKAWTAVSFRTDTTRLAHETQAGKEMSGIRHRPGVVAVGGGRVIEGKGSLLGGIGVSGAPGGDRDEVCASAGISQIQDSVEF